ncbi:MAG: hypothetical protein QOG67_232 [Verrucomicrobiota bacterium]|jgi:hypothetical protein
MQREDDEKLWDLLGRAAEPRISPFFARNVLRTVRADLPGPAARYPWFSWRRVLPATGLAAAIIAAIIVSQSSWVGHPSVDNNGDPVARIDPQDYEVVADLDELLASASDENNSLWDENSSL